MAQRIAHDLQIDRHHAGARLDQVAGELLPDYSRARLQKWIRQGALTIDGRRVKPSQRLSGGEQLVLKAELELEGEVRAQDLPLDILYEDDDLLVLDKPSGLVVHPAAGHPDGTLQNALLFHRPALETLPRAGIVHRLDKDTTGVMVVAGSLRAHTSLVGQLQDRSMSRVYECVTQGVVEGPGTIDASIGRHPRDRIRMAVIDDGKPAVSHYRVLESFAQFTHVEVSLESGRTHQIRVHMQHIGYPLVADPLYGTRAGPVIKPDAVLRDAFTALGRQALHARTLRLQHPDGSGVRRFDAPLPADLQAVLAVLREDGAQ